MASADSWTMCRSAAILATAMVCSGAHAQSFYAVRDGLLHEVDIQAKTATLIGDTGLPRIGGLAILNGKLIGIDTVADQLVEIDTKTGAFSILSGTGYDADFSTGLASRDGDLFGTDGTNIIQIAVSPPHIVASNAGETIVGLDFDKNGVLWALDGRIGVEELVRINVDTGVSEVVSKGGLLPLPQIGAIAFDRSQRLWAIDGVTSELIAIDTETGTGAIVGDILGWANDGALTGLVAVPSPSGLAVFVTSCLAVHRRARRNAYRPE